MGTAVMLARRLEKPGEVNTNTKIQKVLSPAKVYPVIVPCYNGKSLQIHEELVVNGLSAISIKHHKGNCLFSDKEDELKDDRRKLTVKRYGLPVCLGERMKRRNSFWNMHRPELSKLTWPKNYMSSEMLQDFFHNHLRTHGTFCEPLHIREIVSNEELCDYTVLREVVLPTVIPPDEKGVSIVEKSRSVQLNDEDVDPEMEVHKSKADFCVGEYGMKTNIQRSNSHQISKSWMKSCTGLQRESFLPKDSEEVISSVMSNNAESIVEDSGDPARLRTILSPREEEEPEKLQGK